jgi:hypothetical protein
VKENPIDKDKVAENPGLLPYAHSISAPVIRPEDKGKIKGRALAAMEQQVQSQMDQLKKQMQVLAEQAQAIRDRVEVSHRIYEAEIPFQPLIGHIYHLYMREDGRHALSMIGPNDWGKSKVIGAFVATVRMLADHTWEILEGTF